MIYKIYLSDFGYIHDSSNMEQQVLDVSTNTVSRRMMVALDPKLSLSVNDPGSLDFKLSPDHPAYGSIKLFKSTIDVVENDKIIWTGRCISFEQDINKIKTFHCEGALAFFKDVVLPYQEYESTTPRKFFTDIVTRYNALADETRKFTVGDVVDNKDTEDFDASEEIWRKTDYETAWEVLEDMLLDAEGGYLVLNKGLEGNNPITIDYIEDFYVKCDQPVVFGTNLVSINKATNGSAIVTDIVPICHYNDETYTLKGFEVGDYKANKKYLKALNSDWEVRPDNNGVMINHRLREHYPRIEKVIEYDMKRSLESVKSLEEKEDKGELTAEEVSELASKRAKNNKIIRETKYYMYKNSKKKAKHLDRATVSLSVSAADLAQLKSEYDISTGTYTAANDVDYTTYDEETRTISILKINEEDWTFNFHVGELVTVNVPHLGIDRKEYPITQMTLDLNSGIKDMTIGVPEKKQLTKILKPNKNNAKSSYKKDSNKHTLSSKKSNVEAKEIAEIEFTEVHINDISKIDEYHIGDTIALSDYKVGLKLTDGTHRDVTSFCAFTIGTGQSAVPASNYVFNDDNDKTLYAHYEYTYAEPVEDTGESEEPVEPETVTMDLECHTSISIADAYMYQIVFVRQKPSYTYGEVFDIDEYEVQGSFDDNTRKPIDLHSQDVSYNIVNGQVMSEQTNNPLIVYYRGKDTGPYGMLSASSSYTLGRPQDEASGGTVLNPSEPNEDGYIIKFYKWPSAKKWKYLEAFTLYPSGYNVHYELHLEKLNTSTNQYEDKGEITDLYLNSNPVLLTYSPSPGYSFKADGSDPMYLEARYNTASGILRSNKVPLQVETDHIEDQALDENGYSIEFDLTRCPSNRTYGAGSKMAISQYAVNLYYTDGNGNKTLQSSSLIADEYYRHYPDLMWFKPANGYIFNAKPGKDPTTLQVFYKSSPTAAPCKDSIDLHIDTASTEESGQTNSNGYSIEFYSYPKNKEWDCKNNEEFSLTPSGYAPYKVRLYYTNPSTGVKETREDVTADCRFSPEEGHAFHGDPIDNPTTLYAWYDVPNATDNPRTAACPLSYKTAAYAPGEANEDGWSIRFTQNTSKAWKPGNDFTPVPGGNYTPYEAHAYYTDPHTGKTTDYGDVIASKYYINYPDLCYFVPPIGYKFVGDGREYEEYLYIYYKNSSRGQQVNDRIRLNVQEDTLEAKEKNSSDYSIEFVTWPRNKTYSLGEELRLKTPSGSPIYEVHLFYTNPSTGVKSDQRDITDEYKNGAGFMWYTPAPGYRFSGINDYDKLYAYYTGAGDRIHDFVPLSVAENTLDAKEPDADGWSVEFVSFPSNKKWLPGDPFDLAPTGYTPYKAHLFFTKPGTSNKVDMGDVTYLYKTSANEYWYNFKEGEMFSGTDSDPTELMIYHKTNKGVVWDHVPLSVVGRDESHTYGPGEEDEFGRKLYFSQEYGGIWAIGSTFSMPGHYAVTFKDEKGNLLTVDRQCLYNIGFENVDAGIVLGTDYSYEGANKHVIDGTEPSMLVATFKLADGTTFSAETPLNVMINATSVHIVQTVNVSYMYRYQNAWYIYRQNGSFTYDVVLTFTRPWPVYHMDVSKYGYTGTNYYISVQGDALVSIDGTMTYNIVESDTGNSSYNRTLNGTQTYDSHNHTQTQGLWNTVFWPPTKARPAYGSNTTMSDSDTNNPSPIKFGIGTTSRGSDPDGIADYERTTYSGTIEINR